MSARPRAAALVLAALAGGAAPVRAEDVRAFRCGVGVHTREATGLVFLPQGELFCPLLADPKAMRSFLAYESGKFPRETHARKVGSIGVADGFAILRVGGPEAGEGFQLGLEAGIFAQFDLGTRSKDLLNADYLVGAPLTYRRGGFSARARVYHQSSHIGDELLVNSAVLPVGLAFESLELLVSQELSFLRVYAGGEYLFDRVPGTLDQTLLHAGAELRFGPPRGLRLIAAMDVKSTEQQGFGNPAWSVRAGIELAHGNQPEHPPRLFSLVGEFYDGPAPYGQFLVEQARFWGIGFQFQL